MYSGISVTWHRFNYGFLCLIYLQAPSGHESKTQPGAVTSVGKHEHKHTQVLLLDPHAETHFMCLLLSIPMLQDLSLCCCSFLPERDVTTSGQERRKMSHARTDTNRKEPQLREIEDNYKTAFSNSSSGNTN